MFRCLKSGKVSDSVLHFDLYIINVCVTIIVDKIRIPADLEMMLQAKV